MEIFAINLLKIAILFAQLTGAKLQERQAQLAYSEPHYPSPWMDPNADGWTEAYFQAAQFVEQLTLLEKVNLTTGVGYVKPTLPRSPTESA